MALNRSGVSRWLPRLLGPVVLAAILFGVDLSNVAAALAGVRPLPLAAACAAVLPTFPLRSWRWRILVAAGDVRLGAIEALNAYAFSIVVGAATPGRLGELIKIGHLRNRGVPTGAAMLSVGLDRVLDVAFLAVVGAGSLAALMGGRALGVTVAVIGAVIAGFGAVAVMTSPSGRRAARRMALRSLPQSWSVRVTAALDSAGAHASSLSAATLAGAIALTALTWLATYLAVYLCAASLALDVPFIDICGITAVSSLVTFLPISVLGLGTRDATLIALLAPYGVAAPQAVALSTLYLGITLWVVLVCAYSFLTPAALAWRRAEIAD